MKLFWIFILFLMILSSINFLVYFNRPKKLVVDENQTLIFDYWQNILREHPTYRDGYLELAYLEIQGGDGREAQIALEEARKLDPNHNQY